MSPLGPRARLLVLTTAGALFIGGCDDVPFASVLLQLRQPEGAGDRARPEGCSGREQVCLQLSRSLDDGVAEGVSFSNDFRGPTGALPLGREEHRLELEVFTGDPAAPDLLGRADAVVLPIIDDQATAVELQRSVLLAARNTVEQLAINEPVALATAAACDDQAGNAWFLGPQSFRFPIETAFPEWVEPFPVGTTDHIACAAHIELPGGLEDLERAREALTGEYYAFVGECGGAGGGELRAGQVGSYRDAELTFGNGCDPKVAVRGDLVWVVQRDVVSVHARGTLGRIENSNTFNPVPDARLDAVVLGDGSLLVAEQDGGTTRYSVIDGGGIRTEVKTAIDVARFILHDDVAWALTNDHRLFNLDEDPWQPREVAMPELSAVTDAAILSDGTVVALGPEGVSVEGADAVVPQIAGHDRYALTTTVGSALLLWGGAAGVDVLVTDQPALLSSR